MATRSPIDELPTSRASILRLLKNEGPSSIPRIAAALAVTHEAARKQMIDLQRRGWIDADCPPDEKGRGESVPGRRPVRYCLTPAAEHLFPKRYGTLFGALLEGIGAERGAEAVAGVLAHMTDHVVERLETRAASVPDGERARVLLSIYSNDDPFTAIEARGDDFVLIERNCPYLAIALDRPAICSTTVSALRRLTGCEVVRERRFQDGDGRCEFHVRTATKSSANEALRFEQEPQRTA